MNANIILIKLYPIILQVLFLRFKYVAEAERVLFNELVGSYKLKKTLKI